MPTPAKAIIQAFCHGDMRGLDSIHAYMKKAMDIGRKEDADFVIVADHQQGTLVCWLLVGGSAISGQTAWDYVVETHDGNSSNAEEAFSQIAQMIGAQLHGPDGTSIVPITNADTTAWRSFRGKKPMKVDEIRAQAKAHRKGKAAHN